eukprot:TRINITY_DN7269_c0_g1_i1.p1 TRINITY_DN7269_c0_g1~~TRINITY_DN7269_c0_g1_i1.p1  ORF type:complete len:1237 (+),score=291.21 TRINITY_DN7269_c0_g1_i1:29-3739(+)
MLHLLKYQRCRPLRTRPQVRGGSRHITSSHFINVQAEFSKNSDALNGSHWNHRLELDDFFGDSGHISAEAMLMQEDDPHDADLDDLFEEPVEPYVAPQATSALEASIFEEPIQEDLEVAATKFFSTQPEASLEPELEPVPEEFYGSENTNSELAEADVSPAPAASPKIPKNSKVTGPGMKRQPQTLLIDASPIVHAAYHRLDALTAPGTNVPIHGIYGFMRKLLFYMKTYEYDYIALCLDASNSFRKKVFPGYKANRSPQDAHLRFQFELLEDACAALGVTCIKIEGYEADDIIATYATKAEENGHRVIIISPDKDMTQLVTPNVSVVTHRAKEVVFYDVAKVVERWGVLPHQVPHVQAICGDAIDGINGVSGYGPSRASELIKEYGTVENLLNQRHLIPNVDKREIICANANIIERNLQLTKLLTNIDHPKLLPLSDLEKRLPDLENTVRFCEQWGFKSILAHMDKQYFRGAAKNIRSPEEELPVFPEVPVTEDMLPEDLRAIIQTNMPGVTVANDMESSERAIQILYQYKDRYHAIDTEVVDLDLNIQGPVGNGRIICLSIYIGPDVDFGNGPRLYIDNLDQCEGTIDHFKAYFEDPTIMKVWHNYGFDRHVLYNHGINCLGFGGDTMHMARLWDSSRKGVGAYSLEGLSKSILETRKIKVGMTKRFAVHPIKKDGTPAAIPRLPPLDELQRSPTNMLAWIDYSTLDTEVTWFLREALQRKLEKMEWQPGVSTMWDFYQNMWGPFGELLTDIERAGIKINIKHLQTVLPQAEEAKEAHEREFLSWAEQFSPDCKYMNPGSDAQKQQLLFAPTTNVKTGELMPVTRSFKVPNTIGFIEEGKDKPKKDMEITITGLGLESTEVTNSGWPSVSGLVIQKLAGKPPNNCGKAKEMFEKKGYDGVAACMALYSVIKANAIETLISSFISPLPLLADEKDRIHCSLNLNTETGRLSARKPNLQNQPALDKDIYKVRKAFTCEEGNALVVADYGQLELRLLAHVTNCKSMIEAFRIGGDFHSRTAIGMYPEIQKAVDEGRVLLEWDHEKGEAPVPLIKDAYGTERKRAKTLNFSIAYGKTVHGFAKDWGVSKEEAQETLDKWFADRPEVKEWQRRMIEYAKDTGYTRTLMGRYRPVPGINSHVESIASHNQRVTINTPLQGGAADIMVAAMLKLHRDEYLKEIGWRQILQIHDELIFEGPEEYAQQAKDRVVYLMEHPLDTPLAIDLIVDAKIAKTWYEAK